MTAADFSAPSTTVARARPPWRLLVTATLIVVGAGGFGAKLWWHSAHFAETDNATVSGHVQPVATRIAGTVVEISVLDNQVVKAGDLLLRLDSADAQVQIERLKAQIAQADASITGAIAQIDQARSQTLAAQAQITQAQATLARTQQDAARTLRLFENELRAVSKQELDASIAAREIAAADLSARRASANAAQQGVLTAVASRESVIAQKVILQAQLKEAQLQLGYTQLLAPGDGRIGKRTVELGQRVLPGQLLAAVVDGGVWITANFKETQLAQMKIGQRARVEIDAFPGRPLSAMVDSFAPASGATFALLPPDNATGNFTKIVQRVPVKLVFDPQELARAADLNGRIVPGMSATVSIDLRSDSTK